MIMKSKPAFTLLTALAFAALVAAALAQNPLRPEGSRSSDERPKGAPAGDTYVTDPTFKVNPPFARSDQVPSNFRLGWSVDQGPRPRDTEEMGLAHRADQLIHQLEAAGTDVQRSEIKAKLSEILSKQFDARQKRHRQEIEALEAKVTKLKELVRKRQESREEIVTRRLEQLMRDTQGLGW
jgi:peptidoglycan hydrolase CwlO-like protein